jgi:surface antigen
VLGSLLAPAPALAGDHAWPQNATPMPHASLLEVVPRFDDKDEIAALDAIRLALTEVGDGSSYVWYRHGGRLSGVVQPTQSFLDTRGRVCRHILVTLSAGGQSSRAGVIACRLSDGNWVLDG